MKTFISTFMGVLAAGAILFAAVSIKVRLDQWEDAKQECYARIHSELVESDASGKRDASEMEQIARTAQDSRDQLRVAELGTASLGRLQESIDRVSELRRLLVRIFENKPFGIPLSNQERRELDSLKAQIREHRE